MIQYMQRRFALSHKGAVDAIKGILFCALQNVSFMLPVGLLYTLVCDLMNNTLTASRIPFYAIGCIAAAAVINEIIAVIAAKKGFEWAGEFHKGENEDDPVHSLPTNSEKDDPAR